MYDTDDQPDDGVDPYDKLASLLDSEPQDDEEQPDDGGDEQDEAPEDDKPEEKPKVKVTVKDDTGKDVEEEVDQDELVSGYMRQRDYSRKTQELSRRERQAAETYESRESEMRQRYTSAAETTARVLSWVQSQEARTLMESDPVEFVRLAANATNHFRDEIQREGRAKQEAAQESMRRVISQAWERLDDEGITRDGLKTILSKAEREYGIDRERLESITDVESVLVLRDALAYREAKAAKPQPTKAQDVPRSKTSTPKRDRELEDATRPYRKTGRGSIKDLARYLDATRR